MQYEHKCSHQEKVGRVRRKVVDGNAREREGATGEGREGKRMMMEEGGQ